MATNRRVQVRRERRELKWKVEGLRFQLRDAAYEVALAQAQILEIESELRVVSDPQDRKFLQRSLLWHQEQLREHDPKRLSQALAEVRRELQRSTWPRRVRHLAQNPDEAYELSLEHPRKRYRKGWKQCYLPTRRRYWHSRNNNWKRRRKTQYGVIQYNIV